MRMTKKEKLTIKIFETRQELGRQAAAEVAGAINELLETRPEISIIFASAPSQNEFLEALGQEAIPWERITAFNMDEYVGIDPQAPQGFGAFLKRSLYDRVPLKQVHLFDCQAADPEQECLRYGALLEAAKPELCIYGVGENGHLAFNDPPVADFDDPKIVKLVELDPVCRQQQVNDGCFAALDQVPTHALTLTIPALVSAERLFCMVPAATKADAVGKTVLGEIRETLPATILRLHPQATLYIDRDSGRDVLAAWETK